MLSLFRKGHAKTVVLAAVFAFVIFPVAIEVAGSSQAFAEEAPISEPVLDPVVVAPVASFDFTSALPGGAQFVVRFDRAVDATDAINAANYFTTNVDTTQNMPSLAGYATVTYDLLTYEATLTMTDPSTVIVGEGISWGVRNVRDSTGESVIVETAVLSAINQAPTPPGIPIVTSSPNNKKITWVWSEAFDIGIGASGIGSYGYELSKDGLVIATGTTNFDELTKTIEVVDDGGYLFRVWSIDKADNGSAVVEAGVSVVTVLPETAPEPVVTTPVPEVVAEVTPPFVPSSSPETQLVEVAYIPFEAARSVVRDTQTNAPIENQDIQQSQVTANGTTPVPANAKQDENGEVLSSAVIAPTAEGWRIFGIPWYIWLVGVAVIVTAWLWGRSYVRFRGADDI